MKKLILILLFSLLLPLFSYSNWSLLFTSTPNNVEVTIEIVSIPFEGLTAVHRQNEGRIDSIQYGTIHRRFSNGGLGLQIMDSQLVYHRQLGDCQFTSCFYEENNQHQLWLGFAKYLVTMKDLNDTSKTLRFYLNYLDTKQGKDNVLGHHYRTDLKVIFHSSPFPYVIIKGDANNWANQDSITLYNQYKEVTMWKLSYNLNAPIEKNFYVRSTPFPLSAKWAEDTIIRREILVGTKIILDTVYPRNFATNSRNGYNTDSLYYDRVILVKGDTITRPKGNVFMTPGKYRYYNEDIVYGIKLTAESGDTIILKRNKKLIINGFNTDEGQDGDTLHLKPGSTLIQENGAQILTYNGGTFINESQMVFGNSSNVKVTKGTSADFKFNGEQKIENGGFITVDSLAKLKIGNNTTLTFDGGGSYLKLSPNSTVELGTNAKLVFKNGAKLDAQNVTFTCSTTWEGIELENSGNGSAIKNCTFNNAKTAVKIVNTQSGFASLSRYITNNIFNPSSSATNSIYTLNCYSLLIDKNTFNTNTNNQISLYIKNTYFPPTESIGGGGNTEALGMVVTNNTFNGGKAGLVTANYDLFMDYSINSNKFYNNSSPSVLLDYGLVTRNNHGGVKNNKFFVNAQRNAIIFTSSEIDLYNNDLKSNDVTMVASVNSKINGNPLLADANSMLWASGNNKFYSSNMNNVLLVNSDFNTNFAGNCFTRPADTIHILGQLYQTTGTYNCAHNYWGTVNVPKISLRENNGNFVSVNYNNDVISCGTINFNNYEVLDVGFGISDSIPLSDNFTDTIPSNDETKYYEGYTNFSNLLYVDGISSYNDLIINYPSSSFLNSALANLYDCYAALDTNKEDQDYTDALYSALKNFLVDRISSGIYSSEFCDEMYYMSLICDVKMNKLQTAMDGFAFIAMYNPNPDARIAASWDEAEIEALLSNHSGGEENLEKSFAKRMRILEKKSGLDPVMRSIKENYKNRMEDILIKNENILTTDKKGMEKVRRFSIDNLTDKIYNAKEKEMINRSRLILMKSKTFTNEQRKEEQLKDLIPNYKENADDIKTDNISLSNYSLSQNYPNPFNPTTKIAYSLPKAGYVSIKIYDVVGRVVRELVNEVKETGTYSVIFDGSQFASGVYFYRIETRNFVDTKRMVLVK